MLIPIKEISRLGKFKQTENRLEVTGGLKEVKMEHYYIMVTKFLFEVIFEKVWR